VSTGQIRVLFLALLAFAVASLVPPWQYDLRAQAEDQAKAGGTMYGVIASGYAFLFWEGMVGESLHAPETPPTDTTIAWERLMLTWLAIAIAAAAYFAVTQRRFALSRGPRWIVGITLLTCAFFAIMPPWQSDFRFQSEARVSRGLSPGSVSFSGYGYIFTEYGLSGFPFGVAETGPTVAWERLILQWLSIAALGGAAFVVAGKNAP
jgi:hypothetical protein